MLKEQIEKVLEASYDLIVTIRELQSQGVKLNQKQEKRLQRMVTALIDYESAINITEELNKE